MATALIRPKPCLRGQAPHARVTRGARVMVGAMTFTETRTSVATLDAASLNDFLKAHYNQLVVVDYYTTLCGPCKYMSPIFEEMADEFTDVVFGKFDCTSDGANKKLALQAGVRALPTFHLYRNTPDGVTLVLAEVTGTKAKELRRLVVEHRALSN